MAVARSQTYTQFYPQGIKKKLHHVNKKLGTGNEKLEHSLSWGLLYDLGAGRD